MRIREASLQLKREILDKEPSLRGTPELYRKLAKKLRENHELLRVERKEKASG